MGDDLSTGAKIGIGLVILCFLIAVVLALLMVVKNITNSGANQMESGLTQMMQSTYDDYDQTIVTGTKVKSAMKLFTGENVAIVIDTMYESTHHVFNYGLKLAQCGNNTTEATEINLPGDTGGAAYGEAYFWGSTAGVPSGSWNLNGTTNIFNPDGVSVQGKVPTGASKFYLNSRPVDASGTIAYVRDNAKYQAFLIKDSTDTIIGIYFVLAA